MRGSHNWYRWWSDHWFFFTLFHCIHSLFYQFFHYSSCLRNSSCCCISSSSCVACAGVSPSLAVDAVAPSAGALTARGIGVATVTARACAFRGRR